MIISFMDDIATIAVILILALGNDAQTSPRLPLTTTMERNSTLYHDTPENGVEFFLKSQFKSVSQCTYYGLTIVLKNFQV